MSSRETYSIRMNPDLMKIIKIQAIQKNNSISGIIESALKKYLEV